MRQDAEQCEKNLRAMQTRPCTEQKNFFKEKGEKQ